MIAGGFLEAVTGSELHQLLASLLYKAASWAAGQDNLEQGK